MTGHRSKNRVVKLCVLGKAKRLKIKLLSQIPQISQMNARFARIFPFQVFILMHNC
jgi:hypothetical protein